VQLRKVSYKRDWYIRKETYVFGKRIIEETCSRDPCHTARPGVSMHNCVDASPPVSTQLVYERRTEREREKSIISMAKVMYIYCKRDLRIIPSCCADASLPVSTQLVCERHTERKTHREGKRKEHHFNGKSESCHI